MPGPTGRSFEVVVASRGHRPGQVDDARWVWDHPPADEAVDGPRAKAAPPRKGGRANARGGRFRRTVSPCRQLGQSDLILPWESLARRPRASRRVPARSTSGRSPCPTSCSKPSGSGSRPDRTSRRRSRPRRGSGRAIGMSSTEGPGQGAPLDKDEPSLYAMMRRSWMPNGSSRSISASDRRGRRLRPDAMKGMVMAHRLLIASCLAAVAACCTMVGVVWSQSTRAAAQAAEANRRLAEVLAPDPGHQSGDAQAAAGGVEARRIPEVPGLDTRQVQVGDRETRRTARGRIRSLAGARRWWIDQGGSHPSPWRMPTD